MKPHPKNPRKISESKLSALGKALHEYGDLSGIVANRTTGHYVGGHQRLKIFEASGKARPVITQKYKTPTRTGTVAQGHLEIDGERFTYREVKWNADKETAAMIAANQHGGEWDTDLMAEHLKSLGDIDMDLLGFDLKELAQFSIGADSEIDAEPQIDRAAELKKQWRTAPGQLWACGVHRLLCGDSTRREDVERLMGGSLANLIVTSPPYNQKINLFAASGMHKDGHWVDKVADLAYKDDLPEPEYQRQQSEMIGLWADVMTSDASFFYNHKHRYREKQVVTPLDWIRKTLFLRQEIIWSRPGSVTQNARMFLPSDERIYWLYGGNEFYFNDSTEIKTFSTVWDINLETNKSHAVGFPIELPSRCIRACSKTGDVIGEPYCGSGTTLIAAEQLGRRCFGMEISPAYVAVCLQRFADATGQTPKLIK